MDDEKYFEKRYIISILHRKLTGLYAEYLDEYIGDERSFDELLDRVVTDLTIMQGLVDKYK